jgi:hypothetical protein
MVIAKEHRERLALYCMVRKCTQEQAVNEMVGEALQRIEQDPAMKQRMERAKELQEAMAAL